MSKVDVYAALIERVLENFTDESLARFINEFSIHWSTDRKWKSVYTKYLNALSEETNKWEFLDQSEYDKRDYLKYVLDRLNLPSRQLENLEQVEAESQLEVAYQNTKLPHCPDVHKINNLCINLVEMQGW
jgi:hypothetical protein